MKTNSRSLQVGRLRKIVARAIEKPEFRTSLVKDPREAINSSRKALKFGYDEGLTETTKSVLKSITADDLSSLSTIYQKAKKTGVKPTSML